MWESVSWSFDKLREVGVSSYLSFTLCLSILRCFGWFEALNGHLIGSKTWDRIVGIFRARFGQSVTVHGLFGLLGLCFVL